MSLRLKLKHIFIISSIIVTGISAYITTTTTPIITNFVPPIKQAGHTSATAATANTTAFALSDEERYESGYDHGCSDAKIGDHPYLDSSGGESSHTDIFMEGYNDGYTNCHNPISEPNTSNGISEYANVNGTDSETDDEVFFSKQYENVSLPSSPNSTSFHALTFLKTHFKIFGLIVLSLGFILSILALAAFRRRHKRRKSRERKGFPRYVKEKILRKQDHKCAHCRKVLNVVDWDHKNGDRSNNKENNCQALCPNCHAVKTRKEQGKR
jgi:hypothetical protein